MSTTSEASTCEGGGRQSLDGRAVSPDGRGTDRTASPDGRQRTERRRRNSLDSGLDDMAPLSFDSDGRRGRGPAGADGPYGGESPLYSVRPRGLAGGSCAGGESPVSAARGRAPRRGLESAMDDGGKLPPPRGLWMADIGAPGEAAGPVPVAAWGSEQHILLPPPNASARPEDVGEVGAGLEQGRLLESIAALHRELGEKLDRLAELARMEPGPVDSIGDPGAGPESGPSLEGGGKS